MIDDICDSCFCFLITIFFVLATFFPDSIISFISTSSVSRIVCRATIHDCLLGVHLFTCSLRGLVCLFHTRKEKRVCLGRYSRLRPGMHISGARRYHALLATPAWNNLALIALLHVRPAYHVPWKNNAARERREALRHARATCFS